MVSVELVATGFTNTLSVATESHPAALVRFAVNVPGAVIDWPFQSNGNADWHTVVSVELVATGFTVTCSVVVESHPNDEVVTYG